MHFINEKHHWTIVIGCLIFAIAALHYSTPIHLHQLHELYRILFYLPIILAVFRFQLTGGLMTALVIIIIYIPHVVFQWGGDFFANFSRFLQMVMYVVIGAVAGILAKREWQERIKYQKTAAELDRSYQQLKAQSEQLAEIEEQRLNFERLSVIGELAASLAHEVRNPLGSIWGAVEILENKFDKESKEYEFLDILVQEVRRLNAVVENYLALVRQPQTVLQKFDLNETVASVILLLGFKAKKQNVITSRDFCESNIFIKADENQLRQVLINLVLNSLAAMPSGGHVTLRTELVSNTTQGANSGKAQVSIIDTGVGIAPEDIEKIFQPFYTTRNDGTGLGLNIVKRIADQNKWEIKVDSKINQGTTITIIFPLETDDVEKV